MDTASDGISLKRCPNPDCLQPWKPATTEFFYRDKGKKDGLTVRCKECHKAYREANRAHAAAYRAANRDRLLTYDKARHAANREREQAYREATHAHRLAYNKAYYVAHREHYRAYRKANHERRNVRERARYAADRKRRQARNRAYYKSRYAQTPASVRAYVHTRHARLKAVPGRFTSQDVQEQVKRQKNQCYWCTQRLEEWHIDHLVPVSRGGSNWPDNIVIACPTCNLSRNNKLPHEFFEGGRLL